MGKLSKIWKSKWQIIDGIWYSIFRKQYVEKISKERMAICNVCPFIDRSGESCLAPGTQPCCSKCGCSLSFKSRSLSSACGDPENTRWFQVMTEEKENEFTKDL
jgi:hypothetical protein